MNSRERPLAWLAGPIRTPPLSPLARIEMGYLLRRLQRGELLAMPASRPMPAIGRHCHELRVKGADAEWRLIYRIDPDAIVIVELFRKKTSNTPHGVIELARARLRSYDNA